MRITFLFYFMLSWVLLSAGQNKTVDSLYARLVRSKEDTARVRGLHGLGSYYSNLSADSCLVYAKKELALSEKLNYPKGIAQAYILYGSGFGLLDSYDRSIESYFKALDIYEELADQTGLSTANNNLGYMFYQQGECLIMMLIF